MKNSKTAPVVLLPAKVLVCDKCGRPGVKLEAHCVWDSEEQRVASVGLCDSGHYCESCNEQVGIEEVRYLAMRQPISHIMEGIDWELLHRQKYKLIEMQDHYDEASEEFAAMQGIVNLLNDLQDYAHAKHIWRFPGSDDESDGVTIIGMANRELAEHFVRGVEFVNDSSITAEIVEDSDGGVFVKITDEDEIT